MQRRSSVCLSADLQSRDCFSLPIQGITRCCALGKTGHEADSERNPSIFLLSGADLENFFENRFGAESDLNISRKKNIGE